MNAQKFTQKSLEAIQEAQNIALEHNSMQIEQEHLVAPCWSRRTVLRAGVHPAGAGATVITGATWAVSPW